MTDFRERYKRLGFGRENINTNRILRSQRQDQFRRDMRSEYYSKHRDIDNENDSLDNEEEEVVKITQENKSKREAKKNADTELQAAIQNRLLQLEKWREERSRQKLQEKKKAKPVFKVGIVHHRIYSPPLVKKANNSLSSVKLCRSKEFRPEPAQKKVTRATEKRLAAKALSDQQKRENLRIKKKELTDTVTNNESEKIVFASKDHRFKAPAGIMEIPMFGSQTSKVSKDDIQLQLSDLGESFKVSKSSSRYFNDSNDDAKMSYEDETVNSHVTIDSSYIKLERSLINKRKSREHIKADISENQLERSKDNTKSLKMLTPVAKMHTVDNSLDESAVLKVSFDDTEMLHVDENVDPHVNIHSNFINSRNSSVNKRKSGKYINTDISQNQLEQNKSIRKSLRFSTPVVELHNITFDEQLISNNKINASSDDKNASISININSAKKVVPTSATRRSSRRLENNKLEKKPIFTPEVQKILANQEDIDIDSKNSNVSIDGLYSEANKQKSTLGRRKSSQVFTDNSTNSGKFENESSFILHYEDSVLSDEAPKTTEHAEVEYSLQVEDQEMTEVQEDNNLRISNIMDCSVSKLSKIKSLRRKKSLKIINEGQKTVSDLQEESLIKFSPRSSMRIQNIKKSVEQSSDQKEQSLIDNPENLNESNILKNMNRSISDMDKNEPHNLSLNKSIDKLPASFSPFIVMSRGKSSVRKEIQKRRFSKVSSDDIPTKDTVMQSLNISAEEEERTAQFYKYILNNEITRFNEICDKWNLIKEEDTTPEDIRYEIQAAVGQTQLLIRKKFERFRSLVHDCETGKGEMLVTCKDLQGFWDMMYMEIKDCDSRFSRLEDLKSNNWIGDESEEIQKAVPKKKVSRTKKPVVKKNSAAAKTSSLRALIMAARKKKTENNEADKDLDTKEAFVSEQTENLQIENKIQNKSVYTTPKNNSRRSSTNSSNKRRSKKIDHSQDLQRTAEYCKMPEIQLDNSVIYINSERTPAKSILKSSKDESHTNCKSTNKVLFKEQPMEFVEFYDRDETEERNMCLNDLEQSKEPVERRLNFEKELSFDASRITNYQNSEEALQNITSSFISLPYFNTVDNRMSSTPIVSVSPLNLKEKKSNNSYTRKSGGKLKKQLSFQDTMPNTRVLRSSNGFAPPLTPRPKLKNFIEED